MTSSLLVKDGPKSVHVKISFVLMLAVHIIAVAVISSVFPWFSSCANRWPVFQVAAVGRMAPVLFQLELLLFSCTLILSIEICDSKSVVVVSRYIDPDSALQSFAVCNSCGPGFEASETCLAGLRSNSHAIVSKNKVKMFFGDEDLEVSQCRPCLQWYYSNTYGINKTCKACSFCDPDEEIIPCTPTADVVCGTSNVFNTTISTRRRSMKSIDTFATNRRATAQTKVITSIAQALTQSPHASSKIYADHAISTIAIVLSMVVLTVLNLYIILFCRRRKRWKAPADIFRRKIPIEETAIHPRDVTSCEVADAYYTSCGDLGIKSNMSSPEPTTSQRFFNDDIDTEAIVVLHSSKLKELNVSISDNAVCKPAVCVPDFPSLPENAVCMPNSPSPPENAVCMPNSPSLPENAVCMPDFPSLPQNAVCMPNSPSLPEDAAFTSDYSPNTMDAEIPTTSDDQCIHELRTCSLDSGVAGCYRLPRARSTNSTLSRFGSTDTDIDESCRITLVASKTFGYEGGELIVEGSSVSLRVPKGAIPRGETKDIQAKVHVCRPHDWKELRESGHSVGLPQVELGPDGSTFFKPIEVIFENSPSDVPEDIVFEFAEGGLDENASFQEAIRANTRRDAKQTAMKVSPHVAFFAGEQNLHAFYMHFTRGRKKAKLKEMVLKATVFMKVDDFTGRTLQLIVAFYEPSAEGELILKKATTNMKEVNVIRKPIKIKVKDGNLTTAIKTLGENWTVEQGEDTQECPVETIFDPKYVGILPVVDYIFDGTENINSFRCTIDIMQMEKKKTDLKIGIDKEYLQSIAQDQNLSMSSGYQSSGESHVVEEHIIEDSEFAHLEARAYIQQICLRVKDHVGAHYKDFSRNLGVLECVINNMTHDHNGAKEICYQIMINWVNAQENGPDFKTSMLAKIQKALDKTKLSCRILLPGSEQPVVIQRETTV